MSDENFLLKKLDERRTVNAFRQLSPPPQGIDFCSNDYLGISRHSLVEQALMQEYGKRQDLGEYKTGSTGSRLLSGNYPLMETVEAKLATFHEAEAALIFNSGYDANVGLLSCLAGRGDTILYDQLSHASIRDGIRLSFAKSFAFRHNNLEDLSLKMKAATGNIFVVSESVFSMDGDEAPLKGIADLCGQSGSHLIVDEAHATGVAGERGEGLVQKLGMQDRCLARIHTFGKACGVHGAAIAGSVNLRDYLVNFARTFIYTTALPEAGVAAIGASYDIFPTLQNERVQIKTLIDIWRSAKIAYQRIESETPIQSVLIPGNDEVKKIAAILQQRGFNIKPILYPSVPKGAERLRVVLHSFNSESELFRLIECLR